MMHHLGKITLFIFFISVILIISCSCTDLKSPSKGNIDPRILELSIHTEKQKRIHNLIYTGILSLTIIVTIFSTLGFIMDDYIRSRNMRNRTL
ncbi:conserved Plasmodium protein, unknown function [Plasmodium malariae]|uniref:Uncharacterized protein n=1 Tax=Plasmodium malariae TaxID=5858 RepID=A0A1D3JM78_PLAMA|nr:conserved Plasmodium protein, unknown function [Plasmodium malariae]SBT87683.1 conserved Plasmodium protein, unknown function [Plasmodium malariae]